MFIYIKKIDIIENAHIMNKTYSVEIIPLNSDVKLNHMLHVHAHCSVYVCPQLTTTIAAV